MFVLVVCWITLVLVMCWFAFGLINDLLTLDVEPLADLIGVCCLYWLVRFALVSEVCIG